MEKKSNRLFQGCIVLAICLLVQSCQVLKPIPKSERKPYLVAENQWHKFRAEPSSENNWKLNNPVSYKQQSIQIQKIKNKDCDLPDQVKLKSGENKVRINCSPTTESFDLIIKKDTLLPYLKKQAYSDECKKGKRSNFEDFRLINNQWGDWKLKSGKLELCMYSAKVDGNRMYAWEWDSPSNARGVIGYPEIQLMNLTNKSGEDANKDRPKVPIKIADLKELEVTYDSDVFIDDGKFNIAFDLWISEKLQDNKHKTRYELMIWENRQDFNSFGKKRRIIKTSFGNYQLQTGVMDKMDEVGQIWNYIAFVRIDKRTAGKVNLKELLDNVVANGELPSELYIRSIEFGTEIGNSKGYFLLKNIDLTLK